MKINLLENIWLRILALVMGIVLWFHVATEKEYTYQLRLPVSEISLQNDYSLISEPLESLEVVVSATGKRLLRRKWRENGVRINASSFEAGRHTLNLSLNNVSLTGGDVGISLDEIVNPAAIDLNIDFSLKRTIPVLPNISATADEGFAVTGAMNPFPAEVTIVGPRSKVRDITSVETIRKELTSLRNNIVLYLPLKQFDQQDIDISPDSVEVTVEVVPIKTRVFRDIPVVVFNTPKNRQVYTDPASVSVELTGSPNEIDQLDRFAIIVSADYAQLAADGYAPLKIECPSKFAVKNASHERVRIGFSN